MDELATYITSVGANALLAFAIDRSTGELSPAGSAPAGTNPVSVAANAATTLGAPNVAG